MSAAAPADVLRGNPVPAPEDLARQRAVLLHLRTIEMLVHGWDLAQATGQSSPLPGADAPAVTRLDAFLGRSLTPQPTPA